MNYEEDYQQMLDEMFDDTSSEDSHDSDDTEMFNDNEFFNVKGVKYVSSSSDSDNSNTDDEWSKRSINRANESFKGSSGLQVLPNNPESIDDIISLVLGDNLFEVIAAETNKNYKDHQQENTNPGEEEWSDLTVDELKKFFALLLLSSVVRNEEMDDYWQTNSFTRVPIFFKTMSKDRFAQIFKFLKFKNNIQTDGTSPLLNIQKTVDDYSNKFEALYKPKQALVLKEFILRKAQYKILVTILSEGDSGYVCNVKFTAGDTFNRKDTVMPILEKYSGLWHHIYIDEYCNSANLAKRLLAKKIRICGNIKPKRGFPAELTKAKLQLYKSQFLCKDEILAQTWRCPFQIVRMISTIHSAEMMNTNVKDKKNGGFLQKPSCVLDHEKYMRGGTRSVRRIAFYLAFRETKKWSKYLEFFILNCAIFNVFYIYNSLNPNKQMRYDCFLKKLANTWLGIEDPEKEESSGSEDDI